MKCKICGHDRFTAYQVCRLDIIVDGENRFLENNTKNAADSIYDAETPYGPYTCCKCGAEYDELSEISEPIAEPTVGVIRFKLHAKPATGQAAIEIAMIIPRPAGFNPANVTKNEWLFELRSRIMSSLISLTGWSYIVESGKAFNWNDFANKRDLFTRKDLYDIHDDAVAGLPVFKQIEAEININEKLAPERVPGSLLFLENSKTIQSVPVECNFHTGKLTALVEYNEPNNTQAAVFRTHNGTEFSCDINQDYLYLEDRQGLWP